MAEGTGGEVAVRWPQRFPYTRCKPREHLLLLLRYLRHSRSSSGLHLSRWGLFSSSCVWRPSAVTGCVGGKDQGHSLGGGGGGGGGGGVCAGLASWGLSAGDWAVTCPCPGSRYKKRGRPLWAWKWAEKYGCQSGGLGPTIPHASSLYPSSWNRLPLLGFSREPTPCLLA